MTGNDWLVKAKLTFKRELKFHPLIPNKYNVLGETEGTLCAVLQCILSKWPNMCKHGEDKQSLAEKCELVGYTHIA